MGLGKGPSLSYVRSSPPRAANSHSSSAGSLFPFHSQNARASFQLTCSTGWSSLSLMLEPGPAGWEALNWTDLYWFKCFSMTTTKKEIEDRPDQGWEPAQINQRCFFTPCSVSKAQHVHAPSRAWLCPRRERTHHAWFFAHLSPKSLLNRQPPRGRLGKEMTPD